MFTIAMNDSLDNNDR